MLMRFCRGLRIEQCEIEMKMQLVPQEADLLTKRSLIPWAAESSNAPALRSLLLNSLPEQLYVQCTDSYLEKQGTHSTYAVSHHALTTEQHRFTLIGNLQARPDYAHACEAALQQHQPQVVRFRAVPTEALHSVKAVLTKHGFHESACIPGLQYVVPLALQEQLLAPNFQQHLAKQLSPGFQLSTLQLEDAELVNNCWIYRCERSEL